MRKALRKPLQNQNNVVKHIDGLYIKLLVADDAGNCGGTVGGSMIAIYPHQYYQESDLESSLTRLAKPEKCAFTIRK